MTRVPGTTHPTSGPTQRLGDWDRHVDGRTGPTDDDRVPTEPPKVRRRARPACWGAGWDPSLNTKSLDPRQRKDSWRPGPAPDLRVRTTTSPVGPLSLFGSRGPKGTPRPESYPTPRRLRTGTDDSLWATITDVSPLLLKEGDHGRPGTLSFWRRRCDGRRPGDP